MRILGQKVSMSSPYLGLAITTFPHLMSTYLVTYGTHSMPRKAMAGRLIRGYGPSHLGG